MPPAKSIAPPEQRLIGIARQTQRPARTPEPVCQRTINQGAPADHEHDHRAELHPFGKGPANQRGRNDEEHALIDHVRHDEEGRVGRNGRCGPADVHSALTPCMSR